MTYFSNRLFFCIACLSLPTLACGVDDVKADDDGVELVLASGGGPDGGAGGVGGGPMSGGGGSGAAEQVQTYTEVQLDFDDLPNPTVVTDQYASYLVFSSEPNIEVTAEGPYNIGQSLPNYLSAGSGNWVHNELYIDFAAPVRKLAFKALGVGSVGAAAEIRVFENGTLAGTVELVGDGNQFAPKSVNLHAWSDVTRIEIVNITDKNGMVYDDFSFEFPDAAP